MAKYTHSVILFDEQRQREVVVDRDGTRHDRREDGELMSRDEAIALARNVGGTAVNAWEDDDRSAWDDDVDA